MGYIAHHAIIVTGWDAARVQVASVEAVRIFGEDMVSEILDSPINSYHTFFVAPDGSKEGWPESASADDKRSIFTQWIREHHELYLDVVEIRYGGDDPQLSAILPIFAKEER